MKLLGISAPANAGKDTLADYLCKKHKGIKYSFAQPLKQACCAMFGITMQHFERNLKEVPLRFWGLSPRQMAQRLGTEGGRELFFDDIWIKRAELEFAKHASGPMKYFIIPDVRFDNEAEWLRSQGGTLIHIHRDNLVTTEHNNHASEAGVKYVAGKDLLLRNEGKSLEQFYKDADQLWENHYARTDDNDN